LRAHGADKEVYLAATHAVFSGPAYERLLEADFTEIVVTDSLPIKHPEKLPNLIVLSLAPLLSKIIFNIHEGFSVSEAMEN
jgi:ribose-phosphate pyrophosphokinase